MKLLNNLKHSLFSNGEDFPASEVDFQVIPEWYEEPVQIKCKGYSPAVNRTFVECHPPENYLTLQHEKTPTEVDNTLAEAFVFVYRWITGK